MKKKAWIWGPLLLLIAIACYELSSVEVKGPVCLTPVPVFTVGGTSAADSVPLGCPYGYINENGDTVLVTYTVGK